MKEKRRETEKDWEKDYRDGRKEGRKVRGWLARERKGEEGASRGIEIEAETLSAMLLSCIQRDILNSTSLLLEG